MKLPLAVLVRRNLYHRIMTPAVLQKLKPYYTLQTKDVEEWTQSDTAEVLAGAEACITAWGTLPFDQATLKGAPGLKLIAHAAGSVKHLATPAVLARGIRITSAAQANGLSVAEHCLGMMLYLLKQKCGKALYHLTVGLVGLGFIGQHVAKLLQAFEVEVVAFDPFTTDEVCRSLGVRRLGSLEELMRVCDILSLHSPSIPETYHSLNAANLPLLKDGCLLLNTARGSLIDERALYEEAKSGRIQVYLDVTDPEPMLSDNPLQTLPNVVLTPHLAGAKFNDIERMGHLAADELVAYARGEPLSQEVDPTALAHRA